MIKLASALTGCGLAALFAAPLPAQNPAAPVPTTPATPVRTQPADSNDKQDIAGPIDSLEDIEDTAKMAFKLADSDNNGAISQKEAVDLGNLMVGGFFFRADANGDGKIGAEEAQQARDSLFQKRPWLRFFVQRVNQEQQADGEPGVNQAVKQVGSLLDANSDKQIQATELRQAVQTAVQGLFAAADANRDGQMTPDEVDKAVLGGIQVVTQAAFQAADKDKNSQLSQEEFLQALQEPASQAFTILDANGDKQLSTQELDRARQVVIGQLRNLKVSDNGQPTPTTYNRSYAQPAQAQPATAVPAQPPTAVPAQPAAVVPR